MKTFTGDFPLEGVIFTVEFSSTPFTPGYISGPPEDCYPDEGGEVELSSVMLGDDELLPSLSDSAIHALEVLCAEAAPSYWQEYADEAAIADYESRLDR